MKNLYVLPLMILFLVNPQAEAMFARIASIPRVKRACECLYRAFSSEPIDCVDAEIVSDNEKTEKTFGIAVPDCAASTSFLSSQEFEVALLDASEPFKEEDLADSYHKLAQDYFNNPNDERILETPLDERIPMFPRLNVRNVLAGKVHAYIVKNAYEAVRSTKSWGSLPASKTSRVVFDESGEPIHRTLNSRTGIDYVKYKNMLSPLFDANISALGFEHSNRVSEEEVGPSLMQFNCSSRKLFSYNPQQFTCTVVPHAIEGIHAFIRNKEMARLKELEKQYAILAAQVRSQDEQDLIDSELTSAKKRFEEFVIAKTARYLSNVPQEISRLME